MFFLERIIKILWVDEFEMKLFWKAISMSGKWSLKEKEWEGKWVSDWPRMKGNVLMPPRRGSLLFTSFSPSISSLFFAFFSISIFLLLHFCYSQSIILLLWVFSSLLSLSIYRFVQEKHCTLVGSYQYQCLPLFSLSLSLSLSLLL